MNIKNIIQLICCAAALTSVSLMAQSSQSTTQDQQGIVVFGADNPYKIPQTSTLLHSSETIPLYPVTVAEYCAFLQIYSLNESGFSNGYYDSSFMRFEVGKYDVVSHFVSWQDGIDRCILCVGLMAPFHYRVIYGCENDIIVGLQSSKAQFEFTKWRGLPLVKDVCDYLNDKIQGDDAGAAAIQANYSDDLSLEGYDLPLKPTGQPRNWSSTIGQLFQHADQIAADIKNIPSDQESVLCATPWSFGLNWSFGEGNTDVFDGGPQSQITFQLNGSSYQATCDPTAMYHRAYQWTGIGEVGNISQKNPNN